MLWGEFTSRRFLSGAIGATSPLVREARMKAGALPRFGVPHPIYRDKPDAACLACQVPQVFRILETTRDGKGSFPLTSKSKACGIPFLGFPFASGARMLPRRPVPFWNVLA